MRRGRPHTIPVRALAGVAVAGPVLAVAVVGAQAGATAATTKTGTVEVRGDTIIFRAAEGADNMLTVTDDKGGGHIIILEGPPGLNAITSRDCRNDGPLVVHCNAQFVNRVVLHLGDGDDVVFTDIPWWMPSAAYT